MTTAADKKRLLSRDKEQSVVEEGDHPNDVFTHDSKRLEYRELLAVLVIL
jgi:hypothetical protein